MKRCSLPKNRQSGPTTDRNHWTNLRWRSACSTFEGLHRRFPRVAHSAADQLIPG
jgi:hypothetical protein